MPPLIEEGLWPAQITAITNLVEQRIYSRPVPQGAALPYLLIDRVSEIPEHHFTGSTAHSRDLWQIDCYAETDLSNEAIKEAVRKNLDTYRNSMGDFTNVVCHIQSIVPSTEERSDGSQGQVHRRAITLSITHDTDDVSV